MPTYEYQCPVCGIFEFEQSIKEAPLDTCILWKMKAGRTLMNKRGMPVECGKPVKRLISKASFVLKGNGWAKDNYSPGGKKE